MLLSHREHPNSSYNGIYLNKPDRFEWTKLSSVKKRFSSYLGNFAPRRHPHIKDLKSHKHSHSPLFSYSRNVHMSSFNVASPENFLPLQNQGSSCTPPTYAGAQHETTNTASASYDEKFTLYHSTEYPPAQLPNIPLLRSQTF